MAEYSMGFQISADQVPAAKAFERGCAEVRAERATEVDGFLWRHWRDQTKPDINDPSTWYPGCVFDFDPENEAHILALLEIKTGIKDTPKPDEMPVIMEF